MNRKKILVVEDEFITSADLIACLEQMGFIVPASTDAGEEVYDLACQYVPDLILMDINLKGRMTGIEAADIVKEKLDIPVVFLTGQSDEATIQKAIETEPFGYIIKPFEERALKTTISMALYKHSIDHELKISEDRYRMIAESSDSLIAILNPDYTFHYMNKAGAALLNLDPDNVSGISLSEIINYPGRTETGSIHQQSTAPPDTLTERMKISTQGREIWIYSTMTPLMQNLTGKGQILWTAKDITEWIEIQQKMQKEGLLQLEKNMEQFQVLNDEIRNPLTIIASYASMDAGPSCDKILESVKRIDDIVTQLDRGWVESNKVRSFLLRHYRHGEEF